MRYYLEFSEVDVNLYNVSILIYFVVDVLMVNLNVYHIPLSCIGDFLYEYVVFLCNLTTVEK